MLNLLKNDYTKLLFRSLRAPLIFIGLGGILLLSLNFLVNAANPNQFYISLIKSILNIGIIAAIGWIAITIVSVIEKVIFRYSSSMTRDLNRIKTLQTKTRILSSIASVVIGVIAFAAILMSFDSVRSVGISILASAGFLTAIAGLAASKTLFSLFSGIQIVLSQTISIGDTVVIEKEQGTVEEIAFTYVIIKLGDNRHLTVPISYFVEKPFENLSRDKSGLRASVYLYVDYMMPIEPLRDQLNLILQRSNLWDGVASKLQVSDLTDRVAQLKIQISASNADNLSDLRIEVREKILAFIQEKYPQYLPKKRSMVAN